MRLHILFYAIVLLKCIFIKEIYSYNILGVFPFLGKSHFFVFQVYLKELAKRGHNVTVISFFPQQQPLKNYHDINLGKNNKYFEFSHPLSLSNFHTFLSVTILQPVVGPYTCRLILEDDEVQSLLESKQKFDLVVMEQFNVDCPLSLAYKLKAPVISMTSGLLLPWHHSRFGVPYHPSYALYDVFRGVSKLTFTDRIVRLIFYHYFNFMQYICSISEDRVIANFFDDVPPLTELSRNIKFVLLYQNFIASGTQILPSNVVEVGGFHVTQPKMLPKDLNQFIEESKNGVIYISFGTVLSGSSMPKKALNSIIETLKELPQRVLWKWNKEIPNKPDNIYVSKWMPQNDVLAHPNVIAFFSHCGQLGTTEAVHHAVPILGMPVIADQFSNAAAIEKTGLGVQINLNHITKELLLEKFKIILNPRFRDNVRNISKMWHDRPVSALNTAIHWTEFAARYPNSTYRSPIIDVPFYQYLAIDVIFILILIFISILYVVKFAIWICNTTQTVPNNTKIKKS